MNISTGSRIPERRSDIWLHRTPGENALYDPVTGAVHLLNDTALALWDLCDGETRPDEMITAIIEASRMPPEVATEDVERTLSQFAEFGLITWKS